MSAVSDGLLINIEVDSFAKLGALPWKAALDVIRLSGFLILLPS